MSIFSRPRTSQAVDRLGRLQTMMDMPFGGSGLAGEIANAGNQIVPGVLSTYGLGTAIREGMTPQGNTVPDATPSLLPNPAEALGRLAQNIGGMIRGDEPQPSLTEDAYKSSPYFRTEIPFEEGMTEDRAAALATFYDQRKVAEYFAEKRPISSFMGQFVGQAFDPINYVPVFGQSAQTAAVARLGTLGGRMVVSASDAAINTAVFGVLTSNMREEFGDDVSWQAMVNEIGMSALVGGAFGAGAGALAIRREMRFANEDRYRESRRAATIQNNVTDQRAVQVGRAVLNESVGQMVNGQPVKPSPNTMAEVERIETIARNEATSVRALRDQTANVTGDNVAITPSGQRVNVQPEVVDASTLVRATGDLQVRNRSSFASAQQVEEMATNLDPMRLMQSVDADSGAPIVGGDNVIDSGNGRVMAINRAYEAYPERARAYRNALEDAGYVIPPGVERPVLISRRTTELSRDARAKFNAEANAPRAAQMSAVELAAMDGNAVMDALDVLDAAPVTAASNRAFVQRFLGNLSPSARGALIDPSGALNADGARRIENAIVAAAYGDVDMSVLRRFAEATDDNTRAIVGAMSDAAGRWAQMRREVKLGNVSPEFDATTELTQALRLIGQWREQARTEGRPVSTVIREGMGQLDLLDGQISPEAQVIISAFYKTNSFSQAAGRDTIAEFLGRVVDSTIELGRPQLFETADVGKLEVLRSAAVNEQGNLFTPIGAVDGIEADGGFSRGTEAPAARQGGGQGAGANAAAERFGLSDNEVSDLLATPIDDLRARDRYMPPSSTTEPTTDFPRLPEGSAKIGAYGDPNEAYVEVLRRFNPNDLISTEAEDGIKASQTYQDYVQWARDGSEAPPIFVAQSDKGDGKLFSTNRRRVLAAQEAGVESMLGWFSPLNPETGLPLKYKDVIAASKQPSAGANVGQRVSQRFEAAGRPKEEADALGDIVDAFYRQQASRLGLTMNEMEARFGLPEVRRGGDMPADAVAQSPDSPAFREWFGTSKIVDDAGEPLVVYHGSTVRGIDAFDPDKLNDKTRGTGFWFSDAGGKADTYAGPEGEVYPTYLKMERPVIVEWDGHWAEGPAVDYVEYRIKDANGFEVGGRGYFEERANVEAALQRMKDAGEDTSGYVIDETPVRGEKTTDEFVRRVRRENPDADGIVLRNVAGGGDMAGDFAGLVRGDEYVVFSPTQIKSVANRGTFDPNDPRILFQPDAPRNMIVQHNLSTANLLHADKMRGLAVPSLAISNVDYPLDSFGEITLIGGPDLIDPRKDSASKVFDADVYSPRYPTVRYKIGRAGYDKAWKRLEKFSGDLGHVLSGEIDHSEVERKGLEAFRDSSAVQLAFLRETGRDIELPQMAARSSYLVKAPEIASLVGEFSTPYEVMQNPEAVAAIGKAIDMEIAMVADARDATPDEVRGWYYDKDGDIRRSVIDAIQQEIKINKRPGVDRTAARQALRDAVKPHAEDFAKWVDDQFSGVLSGESIETQTASGDWKYLPHTLDNVVKVLRRKLRDGEGWNYGVASIRSNVANQFKSIAAIKAARGKLIPADAMQALKDESNDAFSALASVFEPYAKAKMGFGFLDNFSEHLKEVAERGVRSLDQYYDGLPDDVRQSAVTFLDKLANMPTEYFEAKLQRSVDLSEFKAAVIPNTANKAARDVLKYARVPVIEYDPSVPSSRAEAMRQAGEQQQVLFQPAYHGTPHLFDKFSTDKIGTGEGAQAYGWGLYFAGKKEIATYYRDALAAQKRVGTPAHSTLDGKRLMPKDVTQLKNRSDLGLGYHTTRFLGRDGVQPALRSGDGEKFYALVDAEVASLQKEADALDQRAAEYETNPPLQSTYTADQLRDRSGLAKDRIADLQKLKERFGFVEREKGGRLFEVDVPDDSELLSFKDKLADQPDGVKAMFAENFAVWNGERLGLYPDATGREFYYALSQRLGGDRAASAALAAAGIPGHRFPDAVSRDVAQGGTSNYVIYDDSRVQVRSFEQGARGAIQLGDTNVISLFETADASTALHETGHLFLSMLKGMGEAADAPTSIRADWESVQNWWRENAEAVAADANASGRAEGVTAQNVIDALDIGTTGDAVKDRAIDVGMQEQWARGFEAYVREGKAPSAGLARAFEQFRQWLTSIYRRAADLNVNLSPEIRQVFDNLLGAQNDRAIASIDGAPVRLGTPPTEGRASPQVAAVQASLLDNEPNSAAARVGRDDTLRDIALSHGVDPVTGSFVEQGDIDQIRQEGRLTPDDEADLAAADQMFADAEAYGRALEAAMRCVI